MLHYLSLVELFISCHILNILPKFKLCHDMYQVQYCFVSWNLWPKCTSPLASTQVHIHHTILFLLHVGPFWDITISTIWIINVSHVQLNIPLAIEEFVGHDKRTVLLLQSMVPYCLIRYHSHWIINVFKASEVTLHIPLISILS